MYRLRDLDRRGRRLVPLVVLLLIAPFVVSVVRAHAAGWEPSGDNGIIALQAFDTHSGHPPLVGLPSTAGVYSDADPRHPGPIEFYALALPMKVLGTSMGMVGWTALVNLSAVLVAAWVVLRRAGPGVGVWGAVVLGAISWAQGPAQLTDPVSSNAGGIPMVALAVLAWAVAAGDRRLLPLFALFSAYVTQQHLGVFGFGIALTVGGLAGLTQWEWRARIRRRPLVGSSVDASPGARDTSEVLSGDGDSTSTDDQVEFIPSSQRDLSGRASAADAPALSERSATAPAAGVGASTAVLPETGSGSDPVTESQPDPGPDVDPWTMEAAWQSTDALPRRTGIEGTEGADADRDRWWPWLAGALLVTLLCWLPVVVDTLVSDPSNLSRLSNFTGAGDRQTVGAGAGVRQGVRAIGLPPLIARTGLSGNDLVASLSILEWLGATLVTALLVSVVFRYWRSRPALSRLSLTALCLAVTGAVIGANVPAFEVDRLNLYRWSFVVSALAWMAIGWAAGIWLVAGRGRYSARSRWETPWPAMAALAVVSLGACTYAGPTGYRDGELFGIERRLNDRVLQAVQGKENVLVVPFGNLASRSLAQSLAVDLEAHGHRAVLPGYESASYGQHRSLAERRPDTVVIVRTGRAAVTSREDDSKVLFTEDLNRDRRRRFERLSDQARSAPIVVSPEGAELAERAGLDAGFTDAAFQLMPLDPDSILYRPTLVDLLAAGYLTSPKFDGELLGELKANPLDLSWDEDRIEVVEITPGSALYLYPTLPNVPTEEAPPVSTEVVPPG
ncbi:MAG: hypothetical protein H0U29_09465 [Acidimicrobiia bacterium]|nr:hypothetical protein [Acidimicrobiia bacterium]